MLSVRSSLVSRTIPHREVAEVAKGAQEQVLLGIDEQPEEPRLCERIVDTVFCGGVKHTAKSEIHALSHHTASLHLELEKPGGERISAKINTHAEEIHLKQKRLSDLMSGDTLEFGRKGERAVVGRDSYLIHRSRSKICPTGIPLYKPEDRAIPTFRSVDDIGADHVRAIRHSGVKPDEGMIRCEGVTYRIHFTRLNTPQIVFQKSDDKYERLQIRLLNLWRENGHRFALDPSVHPIPSTMAVLTDPAAGEIGTGDVLALAPALIAPQGGMNIRETRPPTVPTFETDQQIKDGHFDQIQILGRLICANKNYQVRFDQQNEPVVLCDDLDPATKGVQLVLFKIWIARQANDALGDLGEIRSDYVLEFPFPKTETEQFRVRAQLGLDKEWDTQTGLAKIKFKKIVSLLQKDFHVKKTELHTVFESIVNNRCVVAEQRSAFVTAISKLPALKEHQERIKRNINELKNIYQQLFQLARDCISDEMQKIIFARVDQFTAYLNKFAGTRSNKRTAHELNLVMLNQLRFAKQFATVQVLLLGLSEFILNDGSKARLPKSKKLKHLNELRDNLKKLSSEQTTPWESIQAATALVQHEERRLSKALTIKLNYGLELSEAMKVFRGVNGEGLDSETRESFYTPSTYARLVSVKEIRDEFLNRRRYMPEDEIRQKIAECEIHLIHIQRETRDMAIIELTEQFGCHQMYIPEQNVSGNSHMNYSQWCDDQKSRVIA